MKMLRVPLLLAFFVGLAGGCASTSESYVRSGYDFSSLDQVAIIDVVGVVNSPGAKKQIEDAFTAHFLNKGYAPVVREYAERRLDQVDFDGSDLSPEVYAIEAGRILDVPAVLVIHVPSFGDDISVTGKLIDVEQGSVLWISHASHKFSEGGGWKSWFKLRETNDYAYDREFEAAMMQYGAQSYEQEQQVPEESESDVRLRPQEEQQLYTLVGRICESLPDKMTGSFMTPTGYPAQIDTTPRMPTQPNRPQRTRSFTWRDLID